MSIDARTRDATSRIPAVPPPPPPDRRSHTVSDDHRLGLMTVGQLAQRTGLSHKAIRELEGRGLIYTAGRSEANYRLFDEGALWCVRVIGELRALGLTLDEIEQLGGSYLEHPDRPIGPQIAQMLERSHERVSARIRAQQQILKRIAAFRAENRELLAGTADDDPAALDPFTVRYRAAVERFAA